MKQLEDHKVMDPQLLYLLASSVAILVRLKGGHNAGLKLTMILGGRTPKFVHIATIFPSFNISSLLIHKIVANIGVTMFEAKLDKNVLVVQKHF